MALKFAIVNAPILDYPDFTKPFIISCDASEVWIGAVLCQRYEGKEKVITYLSKTLTSDERKWHIREIEGLAIIWACESQRPYIIGEHFTIETDHHSLQWLLKTHFRAMDFLMNRSD